MVITGEVKQKNEYVFEWLIKDFFSLSIEDGKWYFSPEFVFSNLSWILEMQPNGQKSSNSEGYVSLYLHRRSPGPPITVEFTLGVKTVDGKLDPKRLTEYIFSEKFGYGYHSFLKRTDVLKSKYRITSSDTLTLVCNIKTSKNFSQEINIFRENKVLRDYKELFLKQNDSDVTIKVAGQEFPAHKIILSARSPVFETTFRPKRKKKKINIININDFEPSIINDFLCFLYCGNTELITVENVFGLFAAAGKYKVSDLSEICIEFMKENISVSTFCDTITWALEHSDSDVIALATDFFTRNGHKIVKSPKWESFLASNPAKSNELLIKAFESFKDTTK